MCDLMSANFSHKNENNFNFLVQLIFSVVGFDEGHPKQ